jgi:CBS domain-containing protein
MLLAKDIMKVNVTTIDKSASLQELAKLLTEKGLTGVPVTDKDKRLIGMISVRDLIREEARVLGSNLEYQDIYELFSRDADPAETSGVSTKHLWVEEVMSRDLHTATKLTSVQDVCKIMYSFNVHRVPILRDGKVVGIVTAMDVFKAIAEGRRFD